MKILVFTHYFWPEEFRINDCVSTLVERGHQVTVVAAPPSYPQGVVHPAYRADPSKFTSYGGARVVRIPVVTRGRGGALRLLLNYASAALSAATIGLWKLRGDRFDAILVFQPSPITTALPALLYKSLHRVPVLMWIQDLWPDTLQAVGMVRSSWLLKCVGALVAFIYRGCDRLLIQSRAFEANVRRYVPADAMVVYLPNWSDPGFATAAGVQPAEELQAYSETLNVMFAGNLGEAQDLPAVIEAADQTRDLPRLRWLIVGDGSARASAEAMVKLRGLEDRVIFLGRHPADRMPSFFAAADALLVSLKPEPIFALTVPSKLQSYLASGRPVLSMVDGEAARVVEEAGCGFAVPAGNSEALARKVREFSVLAPEAREVMGHCGRAYSARVYDKGRLIGRLEELLTEVVTDSL